MPNGLQHGGGVVFYQPKHQRINWGFVKAKVMQVDQRQHHVEKRNTRCDAALHLARHPRQNQQQQKASNRTDLQVKTKPLHQHTAQV